MEQEQHHIIQEKLAKLEAIRALGIEPYPYSFDASDKVADIIQRFNAKLTAGESSGEQASIAGRLMSIRQMGKIIFADIQDESGNLQLVWKKDDLKSEQFELAKLLDSGDIVGAEGEIIATKAGELSILINQFTLLNKSLTGVIDNYYGLKEVELRYRNRSMDLIANRESFNVLKKRFQLTAFIREFFSQENYLEVETPVIQTVYGGAAATPFTTHHHKLDLDMYLRVSPEQYLKRLLVGGFEAVFELGKNFRNENIDRTHNPEFTMLEVYRAYKDYHYMIDLSERLMEHLAMSLHGKTTIDYQGESIDFKRPWRRLSISQCLKQFANIDLEQASDEELIGLAQKSEKKMTKATRGEAIMVLFEEHCEDKLIQPTHVIDYPKESTVFCKAHRQDKNLIERFESYIAGKEISNGYSELNDPVIQRKLLSEQVKLKEAGTIETWGMLDEEFLTAMDLGLPPAAGIGIGVDRIAMIMLDQPSIRDVIFFPTMKPLDRQN